RTFGRTTAIQRCQVHKARNIMERLPKSLHASVRRVLRQAWELDDADKAEKLLRNLAQRLERDGSGVAGSILEGIDEILTVTRLGLPKELRRSLDQAVGIRPIGAVDVLALESPVDTVYGELRARLERTALPANDLLIAAHALTLGHTVVTDNEREFSRIDDLRIEN